MYISYRARKIAEHMLGTLTMSKRGWGNIILVALQQRNTDGHYNFFLLKSVRLNKKRRNENCTGKAEPEEGN